MHSSEKCLIRISSRPPLQLIMQPLVVEDLAEAVLLYQLDARGIYAYTVALNWKHFDSNQLWNRFQRKATLDCNTLIIMVFVKVEEIDA